MTPLEIMAIIFFVFIIILMLGHPLMSTLGGLGIIFGFIFWGDVSVLNLFVRTSAKLVTTISYVCIPLFIFMGAILERSGVSEKLFEALYVVLGRMRGGLGISTVVICALMGAATGIIGASITIMGMLALPTMLKYNYDKKLAAGTVMAAGSLGTMIPPSVILVIYGSLAQISIAKLFAGGLGGGFLLAFLYITYIVVRTLINKDIAPPISKEDADKYTRNEKILLFVKSIIPPLALILIVLGGILIGATTPNEAAGLGAFGSIIVAIAYKKFSWVMLKEACHQAMITTSLVMWIILTASMFTSIFLGLRGGQVVQDLVIGIVANRWLILIFILFIILIMGMIIDTYGIMLIGVPLFTPIVYKLGFDPLWFGLIFAVMVQMSVLSPPFAYAVFYLKGVAPKEVSMGDLYIANHSVRFIADFMYYHIVDFSGNCDLAAWPPVASLIRSPLLNDNMIGRVATGCWFLYCSPDYIPLIPRQKNKNPRCA